jgi:hypothetical protein
MLADLMAGLGHDRFIAHGSDVGGQLVNRMAVELPERLIGIHVTQTSVREPGEGPLTDAEKAMLAEGRALGAGGRGVVVDAGEPPDDPCLRPHRFTT